MKNLFPAPAIAVLFLAALVISCKKNDSPPESAFQNEQFAQSLPASASTDSKKFHIFYATWTEWGRTSKKCNSGWGLCNVVSCWLCCTNEKDDVVDCKDGKKPENSGKVVIDESSKEGWMFIELDPSIRDHENAINSSLPLYVDQDIVSKDFIIQRGAYRFDAGIGSYGGYRLAARGR